MDSQDGDLLGGAKPPSLGFIIGRWAVSTSRRKPGTRASTREFRRAFESGWHCQLWKHRKNSTAFLFGDRFRQDNEALTFSEMEMLPLHEGDFLSANPAQCFDYPTIHDSYQRPSCFCGLKRTRTDTESRFTSKEGRFAGLRLSPVFLRLVCAINQKFGTKTGV